jgi:hypothetical protein
MRLGLCIPFGIVARLKSSELDLSRLCPVPGCINGIAWTGDEGPAGTCPVCQGRGRVALSEWMRFTFGDAHRTGSDNS